MSPEPPKGGDFLRDFTLLAQSHGLNAGMCVVFADHGARVILTGEPGPDHELARACAKLIDDALKRMGQFKPGVDVTNTNRAL